MQAQELYLAITFILLTDCLFAWFFNNNININSGHNGDNQRIIGGGRTQTYITVEPLGYHRLPGKPPHMKVTLTFKRK